MIQMLKINSYINAETPPVNKPTPKPGTSKPKPTNSKAFGEGWDGIHIINQDVLVYNK